MALNGTIPTATIRPSILGSLALAGCLLVHAVSPPATAAPVRRAEVRPGQRFVLNGGRLLKLQSSGSARNVADVVRYCIRNRLIEV